MAESQAGQVEALIVTRPSGEIYLIPEEDLAAYRLPEDLASGLRADLDEAEVSGFSLSSSAGWDGIQGVQFVSGIFGPVGRLGEPQKPTPINIMEPDLRAVLWPRT